MLGAPLSRAEPEPQIGTERAKVRATKMELWKRGITLGNCLKVISDGSVTVLADWEPQEIPHAISISPPREKADSTCRPCWRRCWRSGPKEENIDMVEGQAHQSLPVTRCLDRLGTPGSQTVGKIMSDRLIHHS